MKFVIGFVMLTISYFLFSITVDNNFLLNATLKTIGAIFVIAGINKLIPSNKRWE